ncbi:MAG: hypothetical protein A3C07_00650 [Candidatus Sungbacteria bacterium RIFCSPHIGHO2_02_FULL_47_11]|uniref:Uncharacterized protein n=1 Tax=Candidatus Sungbacteria bacterium RIFCSPHIGHO2_02_FULL_47_11 TaxID=1802270 RepID=A0A1G2KHB1_9BACT|nr:MAG: hypothetical protein A3C07_00650 [Candidatus Sungbacteria bacterium RIFCSPHIGHO2_02_FULL_47_11]
MKRIAVFFLAALFLFPVALFAGGQVYRDRHGHLSFSRPHHRPQYSRNYYGYPASVHAEAGFYYEPYYGPQYYSRRETAVVGVCGLGDLLTLGLLDACGRKAAVAATEKVALEQIRAGVVTGTMGKEGTVLYESPNGPTSLRASRDPRFSASNTVVTDSTSASGTSRLPAVDVQELRSVRAYITDATELEALDRAIYEIADPVIPTYSPQLLRRDAEILRRALRRLESGDAPYRTVRALADAIKYLDRASS